MISVSKSNKTSKQINHTLGYTENLYKKKSLKIKAISQPEILMHTLKLLFNQAQKENSSCF